MSYKPRNAQNDEWNTSVTDHVNFDVNSTEDTDSLQQHINSLNGLLNDISNGYVTTNS